MKMPSSSNGDQDIVDLLEPLHTFTPLPVRPAKNEHKSTLSLSPQAISSIPGAVCFKPDLCIILTVASSYSTQPLSIPYPETGKDSELSLTLSKVLTEAGPGRWGTTALLVAVVLLIEAATAMS